MLLKFRGFHRHFPRLVLNPDMAIDPTRYD
jgi:hypothetical protein